MSDDPDSTDESSPAFDDIDEPPSHADIRVGRLMATWWEAGTALAVNLSGWADLPEVTKELAALWNLLHARALALRVREVRVDVRSLEFINSSCFKTLVVWLTSVAQEPASDRYRVRFLSSRDLGWQHRSLAAIRALAREVVTVDVL